jgi:hypothetical protein
MNQPGGLLDIVIVNWNSGGFLSDCLKSVAQHPHDQNMVQSVAVVDNASTDGSENVGNAGELEPHWVHNDVNVGFSRACNQGARIGSAPYLLFLNPDTRLMEGSLSIPLAYLESTAHKNIAIVGIQMLDERGEPARSCARLPTASSMLLRSLGLDQLPWFSKYGYMMREWPHEETRRVGHVMGAFYLVRRELFEQLHGFDESFYVYLEDLDFSQRASELGAGCMYLADAAVYHAQGGSSRNIKALRLYYALSSRLIFARKHFSTFAYWAVAFSTLVLEPVIRLIRSLASGAWDDVRNTLRAYRLAYTRTPGKGT